MGRQILGDKIGQPYLHYLYDNHIEDFKETIYYCALAWERYFSWFSWFFFFQKKWKKNKTGKYFNIYLLSDRKTRWI